MKRRLRINNERGQTLVEYILVMSIIVAAIIVCLGKLKESHYFFKQVTEPLVKHITYNYKYGDSTAQGWDEGNPKKHIQISEPNRGQTFRLFQPNKKEN